MSVHVPAPATGLVGQFNEAQCERSQHQASDRLAAALEELRQSFKGQVVVNDPKSPLQPPVWNALLRGNTPIASAAVPSCYVTPTSVDDVVSALRCAAKLGLQVRARGGGHHYAGTCLVDGGMVLDMSAFKTLEADVAAKEAQLGAGVLGCEVMDALAPHGLHFPVGHCSRVGLSGYMLGGGNGWGQRHFGLAADNIVSMQVVVVRGPETTNGSSCSKTNTNTLEPIVEVLHLDEHTNAELFWGMRGGGSFLAIATSFRVRLHPVPPALPLLTLVFPLNKAVEVVGMYRDIVTTGPTFLEPVVAFMRGQDPAGSPCIVLSCHCFVASEDPQAAAWLDKLRSFLPDSRIAMEGGDVPYVQALRVLDPVWDATPNTCCYGHGTFMSHEDAFDPALVTALADHAKSLQSRKSHVIYAGTPGRRHAPGSGIAVGFRETTYIAIFMLWDRTEAGPEADGDEYEVRWAHGVRATLAPKALGTYLNEIMNDSPGQVKQCYEPESYQRLLRLKAQYDPLGLFRSL